MKILSSIRMELPGSNGVLLDNLERIISALRESSKSSSLLDLSERGAPLLNSYIAFSVAVYTAKFKQLYDSIAECLNSHRYLLYAQAGRSILENAATIRHYSRHKDITALREAIRHGKLTTQILDAAVFTLDRLIRGNRFTWNAFITRRYDELSNTSEISELSQVNVQTCLDSWGKDTPAIKSLYHLMCELVHPNFGSNLTVIRMHEGKPASCGDIGENSFNFIVSPTLAGIVGAYSVIQESIMAIEQLKIADSDE